MYISIAVEHSFLRVLVFLWHFYVYIHTPSFFCQIIIWKSNVKSIVVPNRKSSSISVTNISRLKSWLCYESVSFTQIFVILKMCIWLGLVKPKYGLIKYTSLYRSTLFSYKNNFVRAASLRIRKFKMLFRKIFMLAWK